MTSDDLHFPSKESLALAIEMTLPYSTAAAHGWDEITPGRRKIIMAAATAAMEIIYAEQSEPAVWTDAHVAALWTGLTRQAALARGGVDRIPAKRPRGVGGWGPNGRASVRLYEGRPRNTWDAGPYDAAE